jgi:hypothetical protein
MSGVTVVTTLVCFIYFAREAAGASSARHSLRPLFSWAEGFMHDSGASRREIAEVYFDRFRHCEERPVRRSSTSEGGSDEAIHSYFVATWIASLRSQ